MLGALGSIFFGLLIGGLLVGLLATQLFGYHVATIQSFSMKPALDRGDVIVTRPVSINDVKAGDIIVFEEGTQTKLLVAHRVYNVMPVTTRIENSTTGEVTESKSIMLRTKGDANSQPDDTFVTASNFKGKVMLTIPQAGFIAGDIPLQYVFLGIFVLTTISWAAYEGVRRVRRKPATTEVQS